MVLSLLLVLGGSDRAGAGETGGSLTNEDVVRMVAAGRPESEILRIIRASAVAFDLDSGVVEEMRRVGVTETILDVMRERQTPAAAPPSPSRPPAPAATGTLEVRLVPAEGGTEADAKVPFRMVRRVPSARRTAGMKPAAAVEELAFFLVCTTPDHVPDHWADRTPLKDHLRHELLSFRPGGSPEKARGREVLVLGLPASLPIRSPAGVHSLSAGLAFRTGSEWTVAAFDTRRGVTVEPGKTTRIEIRISSRVLGSLRSEARPEKSVAIGQVSPPRESP